MRLAVVSDIHGNLPALEAVLAEVRGEHVDRVVNLGDIVSGPLWPRETAALLPAMSWSTIRGNHERQLLALPADRMGPADAFARARLAEEDLHWLAALPATLDLGDGVWCCHGTPASDLQYFLETVTPDLDRDGSPGVRAATDGPPAPCDPQTAATPTCRARRNAAARWSSTPAAWACRPSTTSTRTRTAWKPAARMLVGRWWSARKRAGRCSSG